MFDGDGGGDKGGMVQAGGLWKKQDRNGHVYFTGPLGGVQVFVFPNRKKEKPSQPDARLVFAQREFRKEEEAGEDPMEGFGSEGYEPGAEG